MQYSDFSKRFFLCILTIVLGDVLAAAPRSAESDTLPIERYALYVASNDGGSKRETLKYAGTDARRLAQTMYDIGGIKAENSMILTDPSKAEINGAFRNFRAIIEKNAGRSRRTEFLFYYSGHSDENAFLLGNETYDYAALKDALNAVPTDVHVVMLDSCFSGSFVRAKGGSREKSFLMDDSAIVQGHAYLSSSAEDEASQESDKIQASYFTHALVTGLRGAADASGDGKVSLNELYYYAFNETLLSTELSTVGPQHPSYNITLVGSGDLVLTDVSDAESAVFIPAEGEGSYLFRSKDNLLVSEIKKIKGTEVVLALPAGFYSVTLLAGNQTKQRNMLLEKGERLTLENYTFATVAQTAGRSRGDTESPQEIPEEENIVWTPFSLSLIPDFAFPASAGTDNVRISIGVFMARNERIQGMQVNGFGGTITKSLEGVQASGFMNILSGDMKGVQAAGFMNGANGNLYGVQAAGFLNNASGPVSGVQGAGFMNIANDGFFGIQSAGFLNTSSGGFTGVQSAGFLNIASGTNTGLQASGFLNIADEITGAQIGIVNFARKTDGAAFGILNFILDGVISPAVYMDTEENAFIQYQGGTPLFFTTLLVGSNIDRSGRYGIFGFGIGTKFKTGTPLSFDLELIGKQIIDIPLLKKEFPMTGEPTPDEERRIGAIMMKRSLPSLRATVNYSFFKHLGVFASLNADFNFVGYNDEAFEYGNRDAPIRIEKDVLQLYPSASFGVKF